MTIIAEEPEIEFFPWSGAFLPPDLAILSYVDGGLCDFVVKIYETTEWNQGSRVFGLKTM